MRIVLASKSPRRKDLMDLLNIDYEIIESSGNEIYDEGLTIEEQSKQIAYSKVKEVFDKLKEDRIVIGADTLVVKDNIAYGKPKDEQDAERMLNELKNSKHEVITSYAVLIKKNEEYLEFVDSNITKVYFKDILKQEIDEWLKIGKYLDRAGAYGVQDEFCKHIKRIEGSYTTVLGIPIEEIYDILKKYI